MLLFEININQTKLCTKNDKIQERQRLTLELTNF
jgi:hypothetical protein